MVEVVEEENGKRRGEERRAILRVRESRLN